MDVINPCYNYREQKFEYLKNLPYKQLWFDNFTLQKKYTNPWRWDEHTPVLEKISLYDISCYQSLDKQG